MMMPAASDGDCNGSPSMAGREVTITLNDAQVAQVVHEASGIVGLIPRAIKDPEVLHAFLLPNEHEHRYSRSLLRALLVLAAFPLDGTERPITAVARELKFGESTAYRYATTWVAAGLLEQAHHTRLYRRPPLTR